MEDWIKITMLLCAFGTLREIRPSEPFVTEFLLGKWRNITEDQLNKEVYPIGTYSYLALLVVVFLITDFLRFKPVIILSGLSGIIVYTILLWTTSLEWLQASQFFYGLYMATEVAYYTYIYAKVPRARYPAVTALARAAALAGRFLSGASAQLLVHLRLMDYRQLNYITLAAQILATFWSIWLPGVEYSLYFHRRASVISQTLQTNATDKEETHEKRRGRWARSLRRQAAAAARRRGVRRWAALLAAACALFLQAQTHVQLLWAALAPDQPRQPVAYNGAVEAGLTLLGAGGAWAAGAAGGGAGRAGAAAAAQAAGLAAATASLPLSYAGYLLAGALHHYVATLASAKIAEEVADESCFGLIFGVTTLAGSALQALLTGALVQAARLSLRGQFRALAAGYLLLAAACLLAAAAAAAARRHKPTRDATAPT